MSARRLRRDTRGLSTVEYILILVIVAISAILLWQTFGSSVGSRVDQATQSVTGMESRGGGGATATGEGDSAGSATAMAITEGRASGMGAAGAGGAGEAGGAGTMGGSAAGGVGAGGEGGAVASAGRARRAGEAEGAAAGFDGSGGEAAELPDDGPDLFLWIGWLLVLILGAATLFSVLGKRVGKG